MDVTFNAEKSQVARPRTDQCVSSKIAVESAIGRGLQECVRVEPLIGFAQNHRSGEVRIPKRAHRISRVSIVRRVIAELRGEGNQLEA